MILKERIDKDEDLVLQTHIKILNSPKLKIYTCIAVKNRTSKEK